MFEAHFQTFEEPESGVALLGVGGVTIVGHGRSSAKAIRNGVAVAYRSITTRSLERIEREIAVSAAAPHQ